jgi:hypothetical protein
VLVGLAAVAALTSAAAVMGVSRGESAAFYRPPRIAPAPSALRSAEGVWRATGRIVAGAPPLLLTTFHPDARSPQTVAYVAWIDHARTAIGLYPGYNEPPAASPRGPAEVPTGQRWRLVATFNGGFKYGHGADGGFSVDGRTYVWLKRGLGTLIGYRNGRVDIVAWRGGPTPPPGVAFARQNLPLLVQGGRVNPTADNTFEWGATLGGGPTVWRTGVGVDRRGNLIYAAAPDQTATGLAGILIRAGAVRAIELDINPEWPTFIVYAHHHGLLPSMFVPNYQQPPTRYLSPDQRDFFTVYQRTSPAGAVPFR